MSDTDQLVTDPPYRRILCAHADDDEARAAGRSPSHWLEPGEKCSQASAISG